MPIQCLEAKLVVPEAQLNVFELRFIVTLTASIYFWRTILIHKLTSLGCSLAIVFAAATNVHAADAFDPATGVLTIGSISVGGTSYKNVTTKVNSYALLGVDGGAPGFDSFDPQTNLLTLGAVNFQGATYNNVRVVINNYSLSVSSYTGESAVAFDVLNAERGRCGFGLLTQNAALDASSAAHAAYLATNGGFTHDEVPGQPGYTGTSPTDRMIAKGYAGSVYTTGEVLAGVNGAVLGSQGNYGVRLLMSGPYHLRAMVDSYREVGMTFGYGSIGAFLDQNFGSQTAAGPQLMSNDNVSTYPCDGSTGVFPDMRGESPNPVPGRDLNANPIGTPVLVRVRDGNVLTVTSTSMTQVSNGVSIALRPTVNAANDPNAVNGIRYFHNNEAYFAPDAALAPNTQYQVTVTGTNNGVPFSRTFTFTTGVRG